MRIYLLLLCGCVLGIFSGQISAQKAGDTGFRNIVIGDGCASTCVNGHCEKTCDADVGDGVDDESTTIVEKEFAYSLFDNVVVKGVQTRIQYGHDYGVKLFHVSELIDDISVVADGGALIVSLPENFMSRVKPRLEITMPMLKKVRVEGNSDLSLSNFELDNLEVELSDNADLLGDENRLQQLVLRADKNSDVDFMTSKVSSAKVKIGGNATVKLSFDEELGSELSGSVDGMADLLYCGNPDQSVVVSDMSDVSVISCD